MSSLLRPHVLDNPAWSALTGPDSRFAVGGAHARRYRGDVSPFAGFDRLDDLVSVATAEHPVALFNAGELPGWTTGFSVTCLQMISADVVAPTAGPAPVSLGEADKHDMLELTTLAQPGPWLERTFELGGYVGVRDGDRLVAMAGERLHPEGWAEISAVCTHPDYRGRGLGARVLLAVAEGIRARGDQPFLHVALANQTALRLYRSLGFEGRREVEISVVSPA